MNILFVLTYYTPHWTGLTEHARRLAEGFANKGHTVHVVATRHEQHLPLSEVIHGVRVTRTPVWFRVSRTLVSPLFFFRSWQAMSKTDCVIAYTPLAEIVIIAFLAKIRKKRLIIVHNGDLILPSGIHNRVIEKVFDFSSWIAGRLADRLVAHSDDYARHSRFLKQFLPKTTAILPLFPPVSQTKKTVKLEFPQNRSPIIGCAGRFVEEKGFDILLQAIPSLVRKYPRLMVVFAGELRVIYEDFFQRQQDAIKSVQSHFSAIGRLDQYEMQEFYKRLDVFVLPSRSDCLAFVQVEAMLAGVPVVATDIPGARVPVKETGMGVLVKPEDPV
ncbi:MAG: glycosyltransferase family 4 protein, partial [Patescibacteria group bacterium]|nr:glycosyltransferase family 4 protein [Patescibacteria group bacterium]